MPTFNENAKILCAYFCLDSATNQGHYSLVQSITHNSIGIYYVGKFTDWFKSAQKCWIHGKIIYDQNCNICAEMCNGNILQNKVHYIF